MLRPFPYLVLLTVTGLMLGAIATSSAQPGPQGERGDKKGKDKRGDEIEMFWDRLERLRRQYSDPRPADPQRQVLLWQSFAYAGKADQIWRAAQPYIADRTLAAAEALFHASDHLEHLKESVGPPPPAEEVSRHLAQVYFGTLQADYFLQEIHDNRALPLVSLARQYYQRAVQSYDRSDFRGADEYGKTAEELVKALEDLAQAATLAPQTRP
jgi:hypothetical protein